MTVRERLSGHALGPDDRLALREEDPELEAPGARLPPEIAEVYFAYRNDKGVQGAMTITVYSDGAFTVGHLATIGTHNFHEGAEAVARAKAMVDAVGLTPKVWRSRA